MNKINQFIDKHYRKVFGILLIAIFLNTCGNPNKITNKKVDVLARKVDSLEQVVATRKDLQIEGLKSEKRMIQSTDRKIMDVNRQSEIDKEIQQLEK